MKKIIRTGAIMLLLLIFATAPAFAATSLDRDYEFTTDTDDFNYQENLDIEIDGKAYTAKDISYELVKTTDRKAETKTFENTSLEDLPETITLDDGTVLTLEKDSVKETVNIRQATVGTKTWQDCQYQPEVPQTLALTAENKAGDKATVTGYLVRIETEETGHTSPFKVPAKFIGDFDCQYFLVNGERVPNDPKTPTFKGYEEAILKYLGLDPENFTITSGHWTSDFVPDPQTGESVRYAEFSGVVTNLIDYTAYYEERFTEDSPLYSTTDIEAVYSNGIADKEYTVIAHVSYKKAISAGKIILWGSLALLVAALAIAAILAVLRRKKKEEEEKSA